ncbi:unnamed protein product [Aureobasidium uvarum]|uniref:Uncharacterized protein n=1 Tax=Aureobasidium uvarum TaxID=2773716 RepID=A0A9N8KI56_9PEZI|nr:unnamed protein product [Aureobasidium uvarum]
MARQTEKELLMARKKVDYEELTVVETQADVDMKDVEMQEAPMYDEDDAAAQVLSQLSISAPAKTPTAPRRILQARGPRGRGKFKHSNKPIASDQVHQRVRLHDPDKMADDRRGGGGYNNRKRRYNRGTRRLKTPSSTIELTWFVYR